MKIAIKANPSRGKEIISLLKSLGGNSTSLSGDETKYPYYIDENNIIRYDDPPIDYKVYTLEEFEKEFSFKIGDKVTIIGIPDFPKVITQMVWDCDEILYSFEGLNNTWFGAKSLKKFEMTEERNITLTLNKAKEWYKKGEELKEIALQAFTEEELTKVDLPRSWEEFCKNYPKQKCETYMGIFSTIESYGSISDRHHIQDKNVCPSGKSAEAHLAMIQLEQLRNCWWNGWVPNWLEGNVQKYVIQKWRDKISIQTTYITHSFLSFPTYEMAKEFLECFKDLIEQAGDLI